MLGCIQAQEKKICTDEVWHRILPLFAQTGLRSKVWRNWPSTTDTRWHAAFKALIILFIVSKNLI